MEEAIDCLGSSIAFAMADKAAVPKAIPPQARAEACARAGVDRR